MAQQRIRFGTDLITFYSGKFLGIDPAASHSDIVRAVKSEPKTYLDRMLDGAAEAGMAGIEFGPDPGGWQTAIAAYGTARAVSRALEQRHLVLTSSYAAGRLILDPSGMPDGWKERATSYLDGHARFVADLGATTIVMGNLPRGRFPDAEPGVAPSERFESSVPSSVHERLARQLDFLGGITAAYGVKIAIHTDAYSVCVRDSDISTILSLTDPDNVQICLDAGHVTLDGGDAVQILDRHLSRIPTMHWKDCVGPRSPYELRGDHDVRHQGMIERFRVLGKGSIDWRRWMEVLKAGAWSGWAIEEIDLSPEAVTELRSGLDFFENNLRPVYQ